MRKLIPLCICILSFTSCSNSYYYQRYKTNFSENLKLEDKNIVYQDANCLISYDLWQENGNIGFSFYNKTNEDLTIDLEKSFFILNGNANNYFRNRSYTETNIKSISTKRGANISNDNTEIIASKTSTNTQGTEVTFLEQNKIIIPPRTYKIIAEYSINGALYRDCELIKYPTRKEIKTRNFTSETSPFVFSNRISYYLSNKDNPININNEFYVSEITNYPENEFIKFIPDTTCNEQLTLKIMNFVHKAPSNFYLKYRRDFNDLKVH